MSDLRKCERPLGIDGTKEYLALVGRPILLNDLGTPIDGAGVSSQLVSIAYKFIEHDQAFSCQAILDN